uniref:Uncharacterized protein n=1 Tax=Rhizophora mucronata TaxID=61149 RepID=A0A2P2NKT8_RHIMU
MVPPFFLNDTRCSFNYKEYTNGNLDPYAFLSKDFLSCIH